LPARGFGKSLRLSRLVWKLMGWFVVPYVLVDDVSPCQPIIAVFGSDVGRPWVG